MTYASIMVAVDSGEESRGRVRLAVGLADRFGASLTGLAAERPDYAVFCTDPGAGGPTVLPTLNEVCLDRLREAHALFDEATAGRTRVSWRSDVDDPLSFLLAHAAGVDLLVIGRPPGEMPVSRSSVTPADAVMQLGRPVLIAPPRLDYLEASRVAIGWKNTREARRAVADAMPFLQRASEVVLCTVTDRGAAEGGQDLVRALVGRGIDASVARMSPFGAGTAEALVDCARSHGADLLVAGAYGHSRLREWVLGGVTHDLLHTASLCCLMSH